MSVGPNNANAPKSLSQSQSSNQASRRWTHFHSALQLAIQRASHKWTYDDFSECFDLWCKEEPDAACGVYNTVSGHMDHLITESCDQLLVKYDAKENIDKMHAVVIEAREKEKAGQVPGPDTWRADLEPRTAVRARTIPLLRNAKAELEERLAELEQDNRELQAQMLANVKATEANDKEISRRLDRFEKIQEKWSNVPLEDVLEWTLRTAENLPTVTTG